MAASNSSMGFSDLLTAGTRRALVACAASAALFWGAALRLRRMTAKLWPKNSPTRSPLSSAYRSWETTTGMSVQREKVPNGS